MNFVQCSAIFCVACAASAVSAQSLPPASFEVASIRQIEYTKQVQDDVLAGTRRPNMVVTDTRVTITYMSLDEILRRAFRIQPYGMSGPDWLNDVRFDIQATMPSGSRQDQVPEMLQSLLVQRFGLTTRRQLRDVSGYALVERGERVELREVPPEEMPDKTAKFDPQTIRTDTFTLTFKPGANNTVQVNVVGMSMSELANQLAPVVGRPVVDATGRSGRYRFLLEIPLAGLPLFGPGAGTGAAGPASSASDPRSPFYSMVEAVERVGLKLEARNVPLEVVVVDRISRTATPD